MKLHSSSKMNTLKEVGNHKISNHMARNKKFIYVNFARKSNLYFLNAKNIKEFVKILSIKIKHT